VSRAKRSILSPGSKSRIESGTQNRSPPEQHVADGVVAQPTFVGMQCICFEKLLTSASLLLLLLLSLSGFDPVTTPMTTRLTEGYDLKRQ
jgi:hypothetical protein